MRRVILALVFVLMLEPGGAHAVDDEATASPAREYTCEPPDVAGDLERRVDDLLARRRLPHEAPDLEAMLPGEVAGRRLATWSVIGLDHLRGGPEDGPGLSPLLESEQEAFEEMAASLAVDVDDLAMAVAGRSNVKADPPYFVFAHRIRSVPAVMLEPGQTVDRPDAGPWSMVTLGGRTVPVGTEAMFDQTEHVRGRPYLYDVGDVRFTVVTDDEAWAQEALARLCPDLSPRGRGPPEDRSSCPSGASG